MSQVLVWRNDIPVTIDCDYDLTNSGIRHLCSIDNHVFVTAKNGNALYEGEIEEKEKKLFLKLTRSNICAIDITSTADKKLIYVNEDGRVFSAVPTFLDDQEEIVIEEDAKCCVHGHSTPRRRVRVKSVAASEQGILFVTTNGQLWALGLHSHLDVKIADGVKRVHYFKGRHVTAIACGLNFYLALVHKKCTNSIDDHLTDNESEAEDVFAYDCPNCISESTLSLLSHQSLSDICPLGLPLRKSSLDQSTSSTTSKGNYNDKKSLDETTSPSTEDEVIHRTQAYYAECSESIGDDGPVENGGSDEMISSINIDIDEKTDPLVETDAAEKKNTIFINTEVARQFLTRQLSWVSSCGNAGEEFLAEYTEGTTRIVRQNVSNVANLVYEGVRTVGDKVATLSRHVSGGSDSCNGNEESFEELSLEDVNLITPSLRFEDLLVSSSAGTSDHEVDGGERVEPSGDCLGDCVQGADLLGAEIYSWGSVRHGQLGIGDCMKRERPTLVSRLSGTGVQRIGCGLNHAVALTLDGRMFAWGANGSGQVDWQGSNSLSSPCQVMCGPVGGGSDRVWDIAAGARHSLVLTHGGDVFFIGRHKDGTGSGPVALSVPQPSSLEEGAVAQKELAAHGSVTWCSVHAIPVSPAVQDLALEQAFLEEGLLVQGSLVRPFQKSAGSSSQEHRMCETLCEHYSDILSFTALNASTLWEYARRGGDPSIVAMVQNVDEHIRVYKKYLEAACNVISLNGFSFMSSVVEPPPRVCELFLDRLPPLGVTKKGSKRNTAEATVKCALLHPLSRINVYKCIIQSLIRCNNSFGPPEPARTVALKRLQVSLGKWESFCEESDRQKREAEATRRFWESAGRIMESVRTPTRRLVRESRAHPIQVVNSGRFSSHWLILLTDVLVHVSGSVHTVHSLSTLWVEPHQDNDSSQHCLLLTMPEETQLLNAATPEDKVEWLQALQGSIHGCLCKPDSQMKALAVRHAVHTFTKAGPFKDAKYTGRWLNGKMHGWGRMEWPDGRVYIGQFVQNQQHGYGRLDMPTGDQYEGQWRDGSQNGRGVMKFACGDVYDGYFKDGQPHGHGVRKEGHFTASAASLYIGEWSAGAKHGYGVMDNICTGEKYLGSWSNNMKHGCGLIVTLDGIYYEGVFMQDVLTGHGVMVFEDGTHYEGEFRSAGCFNGKGVLTLNTGDRLEGILQGVWNDGVKVSGTLFKNPCPNTAVLSLHGKDSKPSSFGKLCVSPNQKWKSIFRQCLAPLVVPSTVVDIISAGGRVGGKNGSDNGVVTLDTQRLWASVAVAINTSRQEGMAAARARGIKWDRETLTEHLDTIPEWGRDHLDSKSYQKLKNYLIKAFESPHHPLGTMLSDLTTAYTATYGGVRVHPLLLSHAVAELHSLVARLYEVVRLLFPALPPYGHELLLNGGDSSADSDDISDGLSKEEGEVVSASALLHPFMLPRVHAALFVLYALHNKAEDDAYWKRLLKWNKQPDMTLLAFLGIDQKFWASYSSEVNSSTGPKPPFSPLREQMFTEAVETLQQLKTTFSPLEKLLVIRSTFEQLTQAVKCDVGSAYLWTMDDLFPVFHFVVVRSRILQLGSEINFIEDFMERHLQNGELGIMFTTLKACYYQILQEKISPSS